MNNRQLFFRHIAQTSPMPMGLEMVKAEGIYQWDVSGKKYVDMISGFSVCNIGHSNSKVVAAAQEQIAKYMHLIVYGEFIEHPQIAFAKLLVENLPQNLHSVYFTNSGAEAAEGALKLAKRATGRSKIIAFNNAYHGSTQGALSVMGDEYFRNAFRPLLPDVYHFPYNSNEVLNAIDNDAACVIMETVQAESGVVKPDADWIKAIRKKCSETGCLLILDEIQAGFGRTGTLWAFEQYNVVPDILLLAKALGGGMPLGAFIADNYLMKLLTHHPVLGHITTFGGHPVSCAAGKAALEILLENTWINEVKEKEKMLRRHLVHTQIKSVNTAGLWASLQFESAALNQKIVHTCVKNGLITDWFVFAPDRLRIAPPLIITTKELVEACNIILRSIDEALDNG
jgi:acetylornithine/succinyldiaminopimelate/putrescine aminotransferase